MPVVSLAMRQLTRLAAASAVGVWLVAPAGTSAASQSDLDAFMERVLARRDENWRKLRQYVLDERETADVLGPGRVRLYGIDREYTWYIRDGLFIRSPVRFEGVTLGEGDRLAYERRWIERDRAREERRAKASSSPGSADQAGPGRAAEPDEPAAGIGGEGDPLRLLMREPQFVSAAYFLRFTFEPGRYAFVGRETFDGREVLRIEYYPTRLFKEDHEPTAPDSGKARGEQETEERLQRQMNKVSLVTLWVEPSAHQIVQYTFDNVGFDFLPGRWLFRFDDFRASMRMGEPFPGVWLPASISGKGGMTLASGAFELHYNVQYRGYREADVKVKLR